MPFINAKRLKALAPTGAPRSAFLPELPPLPESGVKGYVFDTWYGLHAPAKVPREIINRINGVIAKSLSAPESKQLLFNQGIEAENKSPEEFATLVHKEVEKMAQIIKASGAKPEQ